MKKPRPEDFDPNIRKSITPEEFDVDDFAPIKPNKGKNRTTQSTKMIDNSSRLKQSIKATAQNRRLNKSVKTVDQASRLKQPPKASDHFNRSKQSTRTVDRNSRSNKSAGSTDQLNRLGQLVGPMKKGSPPAFYLSEIISNKIDDAVEYYKAKRKLRQVDRTAVVAAILGDPEIWKSKALGELAEKVMEQFNDRKRRKLEARLG